jgi:glycerophosphoryl diester phosphodiesterase
MPPRPLVIAHRGSHGAGVGENTMAAFERAQALGADMIELDVRRTADDELVVLHDHEVGETAVGSLSLEALRERARTDVPRLTEVLEWASGRVGLDVELKEDGYVPRVAELLAAFASGGGGRLLVTSFIDPVLAELARLGSSLPRGLLIGFSAAGAIARAQACGADAVVLQAKLVSDALLDEVVDARLECLVWDFMAAAAGHPELLSDPRVSGVITDDVPGALAVR